MKAFILGGGGGIRLREGLIDMDMREALAFQQSHPGIATMTAVRPPSRLLRHVEGRVVSFNEKPQVSEGLFNGGYLILDQAFLDYLSAGSACILEHEGLERCGLRVDCSCTNTAGTGNAWTPIGTRFSWKTGGPAARLPGRCGREAKPRRGAKGSDQPAQGNALGGEAQVVGPTRLNDIHEIRVHTTGRHLGD